jgi:16S rRNA (cytosine967-C5)-methyltransferase
VELQNRLIAVAAGLVKPGGLVVYANCSILKAEGEDQLARLMRETSPLVHMPLCGGEFPALGEWINGQGALRTMPFHLPPAAPDEPQWHGGMDGFFACRLRVSS